MNAENTQTEGTKPNDSTATADTTTAPNPSTPAPAGVSAEEVQRLAQEAAAQALKQVTPALLQEERRRLAQSIYGGEEEPEVQPLTVALLKHPRETLARLAQEIKQQTIEEMRSEWSEQREAEEAAIRAFAKRPDIGTEPESLKLVGALYDKTDPNLPPEKRFASAIEQFDVFMEKKGHGTSAERIAKAATVSSASAASSGTQTKEPVAKSEEEVYREEVRELLEQRQKQRNWN